MCVSHQMGNCDHWVSFQKQKIYSLYLWSELELFWCQRHKIRRRFPLINPSLVQTEGLFFLSGWLKLLKTQTHDWQPKMPLGNILRDIHIRLLGLCYRGIVLLRHLKFTMLYEILKNVFVGKHETKSFQITVQFYTMFNIYEYINYFSSF